MSLNLRDPAGATAKRQVVRRPAFPTSLLQSGGARKSDGAYPLDAQGTATPSPGLRRAACGCYPRGARRGRSDLALAGIRELITVAAQEIDSSPVKLCDPAVTMDPVDFTRTEKIGPTAPEAAGHPDDRRRLVDIAPFPSVLAISIR